MKNGENNASYFMNIGCYLIYVEYEYNMCNVANGLVYSLLFELLGI